MKIMKEKKDSTIKKMTMSELTTSPIVKVAPDCPITEAFSLMQYKGVPALIVEHKGMISGIFSKRDIVLPAYTQENLGVLLVSDVMNSSPLTVSHTLECREAIKILYENNSDYLIVVDEDENAEGIVGEDDFLDHLDLSTLIPSAAETSELLYDEAKESEVLSESIQAGTWEWNVQTGEVVFNERWAEIIGYRLEELMPVNIGTWLRLTHSDDLAESERLLKLHFSGEIDYYDCEARMRHKDGHWVWIHDRGRLVSRDADGKPLLMKGIHTDITKRKTFELSLIKSKKNLETFIMHAPASIAMFDAQMRYIAVSNRWLQDYGLEDREIIGKSHYEIFSEIPDHWKIIHRRGLKGEVVKGDLEKFVRADGSVQWLTWEVQPWYQEESRIGGIVIFTEDRTEYVKSETHYKTLFERTGTCIAVIEEDGSIALANQVFADLAETPREEIIGSSFLSFLADSDKEEVQTNHERRLQGREAKAQYEINFVTGRGNRGYGLLFAALLPDTRQTVISIIDITQKKQSEMALLESEARYHSLFEETTDMIHIVDMNGHIMEANTAELKALGYKQSEYIGMRLTDLIDPEYLADTKESLAKVMQGEKLPAYETVMVAKDKHRINVEVSATPSWEDGKVVSVRAILRDITERKMRERELLRSAAIYNNLTEGIFITDLDANILGANPAFTAITGYKEEEVIGKNPNILSSGHHEKAFFVKMWDGLLKEGIWQGEVWNRRKDGDSYPEWLSISTIKDENNVILNYIAVFTDISQIKKTEDELEFFVHYDPLTELPNRVLLHERLEHSLERSIRKKEKIAVFYIDLDHFKEVNDSFGHPFGDLFLVEVSKSIEALLRDEDTVSRVSGDEFIVVLEDVKTVNNAALVADKILKEISKPRRLEGHEITITASIGISMGPLDGKSATELMKNADTALYRAKQEGRNSLMFFSQDMEASSLVMLSLHSALHNALEKEEFVVYYQPQVDMERGLSIGTEALVRWNSPELGFVSPADFIPLAEDTGLIIPLGVWVLRQACFQMKRWLEEGSDFKYVAVNVAARQLSDANFIASVKGALNDSMLDPKFLELEITESTIMQEEHYISLLHEIKALGVRLSIDDFGTGYSSLLRLKHMPIDKLKIDQSFIGGLPDNREDIKITEVIISLAKSLEIDVIAEGVETAAQAEYLVREGCKKAQGYYYSRPVPASEIKAL